jgi:hypothetical protein
MKIVCVALIALCISTSSFAQNFEGEIIYQNSYKSKIPNLTDQKFTRLMGSTQDYFIKGSEYKSISNGAMLQWLLYVPSENKMYSKMSNSEAALWTDAGTNPDSVLSVVLNKNVTDILGYKCDELIFNCKSGTQKYYFSSKLSMDPKLYLHHKYGNWYTVLSKAKAVPLKMLIENAQFVMTSIAVEVKPAKLDDAIFQLPPGLKVVKSPY